MLQYAIWCAWVECKDLDTWVNVSQRLGESTRGAGALPLQEVLVSCSTVRCARVVPSTS